MGLMAVAAELADSVGFPAMVESAGAVEQLRQPVPAAVLAAGALA